MIDRAICLPILKDQELLLIKKMEDDVPADVKQRRLAEIIGFLQGELSRKKCNLTLAKPTKF